jgi:hypothetical protein
VRLRGVDCHLEVCAVEVQHRRRVVLALLIYVMVGTEMPGYLDLRQLHLLEVHTIIRHPEYEFGSLTFKGFWNTVDAAIP